MSEIEEAPGDFLSLSRFGGDAALVIGAGAVANAFSYVFHFLVSRQLGPERYGTLVTLMAVGMMLGVLGSSMGTVSMQETARMWASRALDAIGPFVRRAGRFALGIALAVAVVLLALSFVIGPYVRVTAPSLWLILAGYAVVAVLAASARGAAQGAHLFSAFAGSLVGEGATKVIIGCGLVALGFGVAGALGGLLGSSLTALLIAYVPLAAGAQHARWEKTEHLRLGGEALKVLAVNAAVTVLLFVDMLFAKHHFSNSVAGYFGAAGTLSRVLPFGIGLIALVIMPKAAAALHIGKGALSRVLAVAAASAGAAALAGLAILVGAGGPIITLTFGTAFTPAASFVHLYAIDEALFAAWIMAVAFLLAVSRYEVFAFLAAAVVVEIVGFAFFGATPPRLLSIAIVVNAVLVPTSWALALRSLRNAPQASSP